MEIIWHGETCFEFKDKNKQLFINPDRKMGRIKSNIVLSSLTSDQAEIDGECQVFDWAGEYEVSDVPINALSAFKKAKEGDRETGEGESTLIFRFEVGGVKFCHLGELGHTLNSDQLNEIGDVDVLMIKVGNSGNLEIKRAMEVIESIEPRVVIPMGSENPETAFKEIDGNMEKLEKLVLKSRADLPETEMRYISLTKL